MSQATVVNSPPPSPRLLEHGVRVITNYHRRAPDDVREVDDITTTVDYPVNIPHPASPAVINVNNNNSTENEWTFFWNAHPIRLMVFGLMYFSMTALQITQIYLDLTR